MIRSLKILTALFVLACCHGAVLAQDYTGSYPQLGVTPTTAYRLSNIDRVDTQTGNLSIDIPLYSLPQRGGLKLSFSVVNNSAAWIETYTCPDACYRRHISADGGFPGQGTIVLDQSVAGGPGDIVVSPLTTSNGCGYCADTEETSPIVADSRLGRHALAQDSNDLHRIRAIDGSGYMLYTADDPRPASYSATVSYRVVDRSGNSSTPVQDPTTNAYGYKYSDLLGHSIYQYYSPLATITDSLNRTFTDPTQLIPTASTDGCPTPSGANQPLVGSSVWTPPHSYGSGTYKFCYVQVYVNTHFYPGASSSCDGTSSIECSYETQGPVRALSAIVLPDGSAWTFTYDSANSNDPNSYAYGEIIKVGYPTGGSASYSYVTQTSCAGGPYPWSSQSRVISTKTLDDANGHSSTWSYAIGIPSGDPNVASGSPLPSFTMTVHSPSVPDPSNPSASHSNDVVYTYTDQGQVSGANPSCNYALTKQDEYEGSSVSGGTLLKSTSTTYTHALTPSLYPFYQRYGAVLPSSVSVTIPGAGTSTTQLSRNSSFQAIETDFSRAQNGNWTYSSTSPQTIPLDRVTDTSVTDYDGSTVLKSTHTDYAWQLENAYYQANLLDLPGQQTVSGPSNSLTTTYCYDNSSVRSGCSDPSNTSPTGARGNLTKVMRGGVTTTTSYTADGMPSSATDGRGNTTTTVYDSTAIFPSSITKAGLTNSYTYDSITGNVLTHTDPNNVTTTLTYADPLNRITLVQLATGLAGEAQRQFQYSNPTTVVVRQDKASKADGLLTTTILTDGIGRTISQTAPSGATVKTVYTPTGQVQATSNPYFGTNAGPYTSYVYDALGRTRIICDSDNNQQSPTVCIPSSGVHSFKTYAYSGNVVTETDEEAHSWTRTNDALSRLTKVVEPTGATTNYNYDAFGNVLNINQPGISGDLARTIRRFTYDSLSRLSSSFNPETGWVCYGTTGGQAASETNCSPSYDGNNNLQLKTDARGVVSAYTYDSLDRLISAKVSGGGLPTQSSCYTYGPTSGSVTYGIGRLAGEWTQASDCPSTFTSVPSSGVLTSRSITSYDAMGRAQGEVRCVLTHCNSSTPQSYSYDLAGDLTAYNDGRGASSFTQSFDAAGRLQTVQRSSGGVQTPVLNILGYDPAGWNNAVLGSVLTEKRTFDNRMRVQSEIVRKP